MKVETKQQESIMQYLLGLVGPEEASSLEERLLTDKEFYEELSIAEDELIDQYHSGDLSESEHQLFESHFLATPERQRKTRFGRALNSYVATMEPVADEDWVNEDFAEGTSDVPKPPPKPQARPWYSIFLPSQNPVLSYSLVAALVLIVGVVTWLALRNPRVTGPRDLGKIQAVIITPGVTRSENGGIKRITIGGDTDTVRLQLQLTRDDYTSYRATLLLDGQTNVWSEDHLPSVNEAATKSVSADIPARVLTAGDYQMKLAGQASTGSFEDVGSYRFRVGR